MAGYLAVLGWQLGSSPGTKYFLLSWLKRYGASRPVNGSVKRISAELGVTDRVASTAIAWLLTSGWLKKFTPAHNGRGRPRNAYRYVGPELPAGIGCPNEALIDGLFEPGKGVFGSARKDGLDLKDRLLLAVLLFHADELGVVRGLGRTQLGWLTSMSKQTVARRIRALGASGYVRAYVAGVRGFRLFGQAAGAHFLNLDCPGYMGRGRTGLITVFEPFLETEGVFVRAEDVVEGKQIFELAAKLARGKGKCRKPSMERRLERAFHAIGCDDSLEELLPLFKAKKGKIEPSDSERGSVAWYLQMKIEEYASDMLSRRWGDLSGRGDLDLPDLMARIRTDLAPTERMRGGEGGDGEDADTAMGSDAYDKLAVLVFRASHKLAQRLKTAMSAITGVDFGAMNHCIMPCLIISQTPDFRSIISFYKEEVSKEEVSGKPAGLVRVRWGYEGQARCADERGEGHHVTMPSLVRKVKWFRDEAELPRRDLLRAGLCMSGG